MVTYFICLTIVLFPDSPAPRGSGWKTSNRWLVYHSIINTREMNGGLINIGIGYWCRKYIHPFGGLLQWMAWPSCLFKSLLLFFGNVSEIPISSSSWIAIHLANNATATIQWVGQTPNLCCRFSITAQNFQTTLSGFPEYHLFCIPELFRFYGIALSEAHVGFFTSSVGDE